MTNTGSFICGSEGYEVYLTAFAPGDVICALAITGISSTIRKRVKRTGNRVFVSITNQLFLLVYFSASIIKSGE
jgi:hypothetical protein